ncbi:Cna B-type domain-containing protein [Oribacterium sp. P6A1]|uniref:Cna B-type domain-containing protein n=1 Tax=Oribacterium sp. P6A1 TaxID=1410612 RepID=UPI00055C1A01|nr:Cna B-type domain-containing protein [Oribacterium sp. P6A1]
MNKLTKQLLSLFLCVLMVIESGFNAGITGYATEKASGSGISVYAVKVFGRLKEDVAYQTVEFGTPKSSLNLPKTIYALASDEEAEQNDDEDEVWISTASSVDETATSSEASKSQLNKSVDFMTDDQKEALIELLSDEEKPTIKELEEKSGLNLKGYTVIDLPLTWESDMTFGGEYDPKTPGVYSFTSEVKKESKYVLYDSALPTISVEVLEENSEAFSAVWSDDDVEITVTAPAGVFPNDSILKVERITDEQDNRKIEEAVEKTLDGDKSVKDSFSYDIKVTDPEGNELEPVTAGGKKVEVTFKSQAIKDASMEEDQYVSVYHFKDVDKEDVEKAARAKADEADSFVGAVVDSVVSFVTRQDSGEKLKKPEYIKAEETEEAVIEDSEAVETENSEKIEKPEETDSKDQKSGPKTDDSDLVSEDGELTVKTKDFSIYTVAFYSEKSNIKAYYISLGSDSDSKYSYEEGDTLTLSITAEGGEEKKIAAIYSDEDTFEAFRQQIAQNPDDLLGLLEDENITVGSEISDVPAKTGNIGLIADSKGISIKVTALHRNGVTYKVTSREKPPVDEHEAVTFKGIYWDLDQKFYAAQSAPNVEGKITYELSGFGSNGGKATVSVIDKDNGSYTLSVDSDSEGNGSFEVNASDKSFTIDSTDIVEIKPADRDDYSYTPEGGPHAISIDASEPTSFTFINNKNYAHTVHLTVTKDGVLDSSDLIDYTISGLSANEDVIIRKKIGSEVVDDAAHKAGEDEGTRIFTLPASIASFSVLAKEKTITLSAAANENSADNLIRRTDLLPKNLSDETALELVFDVPKFTVVLLDESNLDEHGNPRVIATSKYSATEEYNNLNGKGDLAEISALFNVPEYRFKNATITIGSDSEPINLGSDSKINYFKYQNGTADPVAITEDVTLTLNYTELISYPVYLYTENVTAGTDINFIIDGLGVDNVCDVYILNKSKEIKNTLSKDSEGRYTFKREINSPVDYYLLVVSDDKDLTMMVDASGTTFQRRLGTGVNPITLVKKAENSDYKENQLFIENRGINLLVKKLWKDDGKSDEEKNAFVGADVENYMYLEYFIEGISTEWKRLDADSMKGELCYGDGVEDSDVPRPTSANLYEHNVSVYTYKFSDGLYDKYVFYNSETGKLESATIKYRIAEEGDIKKKYFSKYIEDADDRNGMVLCNNEIQTFKATIKWNDEDARKEGDINQDRPSVEDWLNKNTNKITLYKVLKGDKDNPVEVELKPAANSFADIDDFFEGAISVVDNGDTWSIEIKGYAFDDTDYPVHYYLTEELEGLPNTTGTDGNEIINRHYVPSYENTGNASNYIGGLYDGGTLVNILAGQTQYKMYKLWKDTVKTKEDLNTRPEANIIIYRHKKTDDGSFPPLAAIQDETVERPIVKNIIPFSLYELTLPLKDVEGNERYFDAYNRDGAEFIYVGKEKTETKQGTSPNHYVTELLDKNGAKVEGGLHDGHFVYNGETLINLIKDTVSVNVSKTWHAVARQDTEAKVTFKLYSSLTNPANYSDLESFKAVATYSEVPDTEKVMDFSAEVTSDSHTWHVDKYDEEGRRLYYFVEEAGVQTKVGTKLEDANKYSEGGREYFLTKDGYRYVQSVTRNYSDNTTHFENTLVGNAQVKLVKNFKNGLYDSDKTKFDNGEEISFRFDVYQDKIRIGTIVRTYKKGSTYNKLNDDGTYTETILNSSEDFVGLTDVIIVDRYDTAILKLENSSMKGLLPRYDDNGVEYTYSIFEHEEDPNRGYIPTVINEITEPTYSESDNTVVNPYIGSNGKENADYCDKYLLDSVSIINGIGEYDYATVYKEWLDGDDSESRENVTFVLQQKKGDGEWTTVADKNGYSINPNDYSYSKYVFIELPNGQVKTDFNNWRNNGYQEKDGSGEFRVLETKLGDKEVHYYTGKDGETVVNSVNSDWQGKPENKADHYLSHDWNQYEGGKKASIENLSRETDDFGFVQGSTYDYDVLLINSETAKKGKATSSYIDYQYFMDKNVIANRNFDFALCNVRVGVVYVDIHKTWNDGNNINKSRPDAVELKVKIKKGNNESEYATETVELNAENDWTVHLGPYRKYGDKGELIEYEPEILKNADGNYEKLIYKAGREDKAEKYSKLYAITSGSNRKGELSLGEENHTGDRYTISLVNELSATVTPVVNKFWDDSDEKTNTRPDIYTHLYRKYVNNEKKEVIEQVDEKTYVDYDWYTIKDKKTNNWWQEIYAPMPRFSQDGNFYEYTYYIGEAYDSENTNEYTQIGAFTDAPDYTDESKTVAKYDYEGKTPQTLPWPKVADGEEQPHIFAAEVTLNPDEAGTIVNRPYNDRTVKGLKIYEDIPEGYSTDNLPTVTVRLMRSVEGGSKEPSPEYYLKPDGTGKKILEEKIVDGNILYLTTELAGANSLKSKEFKFYNTDAKGNKATGSELEEAKVPKYDKHGRPYIYTIEEVEKDTTNKPIESTYEFNVNDDSLTNGIQASNKYRKDQDYSITFYKKWTGFDPETGKFDDKYLKEYFRKDENGHYVYGPNYLPTITIRLYRYLLGNDGKVIGEPELIGKDGKATTNESDAEITLTYDMDKDFLSYTWNNLPYYAPNLNPYKYMISEKYVKMNDGRIDSNGYEHIYEAKVTRNGDSVTFEETGDNLFQLDANNKQTKLTSHGDNWKGYDIEVKGTYTPPTEGTAGHGTGTAAIINGFSKIRGDLIVKKAWQNASSYDGIDIYPDSITFELYKAKDNSVNNGGKDKLIDTFELKKNDNPAWTHKIEDNLLYYEPRGYRNRYYIKEVVPTGEKAWNFVPFVYTTNSVVTCVDREIETTLTHSNKFKTVTLYANKELNNGELSTKEIQTIYKMGAIPEKITYRIYYKVQDGDSGWKLLTKTANGTTSEQTITSPFNYDAGKFNETYRSGLPAYAYDEDKNNYFEISYCAVEYKAHYKTVTMTRSEDSIAAELSSLSENDNKFTSSVFDGFAGFKSMSSETVKNTLNDSAKPSEFRTTVNNDLDLTELKVTKTWEGEKRDFGSDIKSISFALQKRLKGSDKASDWKTVEKWNADKVENWTETIDRKTVQTAYFKNLPLKGEYSNDYINGKEYEYRAVETKITHTDGTVDIVLKGDNSSTGDQNGDAGAYVYESTNSYDEDTKKFETKAVNTLKLGEIAVTKKWEDFGDKYGLRPTTLIVKLFASGKVRDNENKQLNKVSDGKYLLESKTLSDSNWTATWSELPLYGADGSKITYTLEEYVKVGNDEVPVYNYDATSFIKPDGDIKTGNKSNPVELVQNDTVEVQFTNKLITTSYIVEKYWDTDETDPTRAYVDGVEKKVTVALQRYDAGKGEWEFVRTKDGEKVTAVLEYSNVPELCYRHEWNDLPAKDADNNDYRYRAIEEKIQLISGTKDKDKTFNVTTPSETVVDGRTIRTGVVGGYDYKAEEQIGLSVLSNKLKKRNLSITKLWDDDNDRDGIRPESVTFYLQRKLKSEAKDKWATLSELPRKIKATESGEWETATWENLPMEDAFGEKYTYRVVEKDITDGYILRRSDVDVDYSVFKRIYDAIMEITAPVRRFIYKLLTGQDLDESYYDEGFVLDEDVETTSVTYVNIHDLETVDVEVQKEWIDQNDKYGERPERIWAALYEEYFDPVEKATVSQIVKTIEIADGARIEAETGKVVELDNPVILSSGNGWKATWSNLPKYKRGFSGKNRTEIRYVVKESPYEEDVDFNEREVEGYTKTKAETERKAIDETNRVENSNSRYSYVTALENTVATTSVIARKSWDEGTDITKVNEEYERYVNIALEYSKDGGGSWKPVINHLDENGNHVASGSEVTAVLSESNEYSYVWDDLPVYGNDGDNRVKLSYRAVEKSLVTVDKETRERAEVKLDGKVIGAYNYDFDKVDQENGTFASYLSNILRKGDFSVTKVWEDDDDRDGKRPGSIKFHLQRKLESESDDKWKTIEGFDQSISETDSGEWEIASWSQLPLKAPNGVSYVYRAYEDEAEANLSTRGYEFVAAEGVLLEEGELVKSTCSNIHKPGTVDVTVTKKWDDKDNKYGDRPEKISVTLWAYFYDEDNQRVDVPVSRMLEDDDLSLGTVKFDDYTLDEKNNWTVTWTDLPEYKRGFRGKEISYYVLEDDFGHASESDNKVNGYIQDEDRSTVKVTEDASGKKIFEITITNALDTVKILVRKNWENEYAGVGKNVTGAEVVLQRKTEGTDWINVTENGTDFIRVISKPETSITIDDLPAFDSAGNRYSYRAVESRIYLSDGSSVNVKEKTDDLTGGHVGAYIYKSDTTETEDGFITDITNRMDTASLKVSKIWSDDNNKSNKRPKELKVTLKTTTVDNGTTTDITIDGLKTETVLNAANNWADDTTWASVPVYTADGKRIYYTFTEESITGYKASYKSVTYGTEARTGDGTVAARVFTESEKLSEVVFTNSYTGGNGGGGGSNGGGGDGGSGGDTLGGTRDNPGDSTDDGEVLGANREIPEEPAVLGASRTPKTGDESNMIYYGIGAIFSLAVLAAWFYASKKRKRAANVK